MLRLVRFLRRQPGLADLRISELPAECGVRETVTIVGRTRMTTEAYMRGYLWPDALCYSFSPIDLHRIGEATKLVLPDKDAVPTLIERLGTEKGRTQPAVVIMKALARMQSVMTVEQLAECDKMRVNISRMLPPRISPVMAEVNSLSAI